MRNRCPVPALLFAALALLVILLPACRSTEHTVARIVTPTPGPVEVEAAPAPEPATPRPTPPPAAPPTRTPTPVAAMPVATAPPGPRSDRSPGVLYEELVPTARVVTPLPTRTATPAVAARATRTPTRAPATPLPTRTATPLPTRIPSPVVTSPPPPTATRASTAIPTVTPGRRPAGPGGAYYEDEQGNPLSTPTP